MALIALVVSGAVAWTVTSEITPKLAARAPLRAANHRGLPVATGMGIAVVLGTFVALAVLTFLPALGGGSRVSRAVVVWPFAAALGSGAVFGAWRDLSGDRGPHRWRTHGREALAREPSGGAVLLTGAIAVAVLVVPPVGLPDRVLAAAVVLACASVLDLMDGRPGRAAKVGSAAMVPCLVAAGVLAVDAVPVAGALAAALAAFLRYDLRERAMLGSLGTFSIGTGIGFLVVILAGTWVQIGVVAGAIGLHALARRVGLERLIAGFGPATAIDRLGTVPAAAQPHASTLG